MGFLDSLTWHVLGGGKPQVALYNAMIDVIRKHPDGLAGILKPFNDAGMENLVDSWVGAGVNLPTTPDQIRTGLGENTIREIARQTSMTEDDAASRLSQLLPCLIDTLTPRGTVHRSDLPPNRMTFLAGLTL